MDKNDKRKDKSTNKYLHELVSKRFKEVSNLESKPWQELLSDEQSDRAIAVASICIIDELLKRILRCVLINHRKSDRLFKEDRMLHTICSKINFAFFLGLIPSILYDDLLLINRIRNIFAHTIPKNPTFEEQKVYDLLIKCKLGPREMGASKMPKWRFIITVTQLIDHLSFIYVLTEHIKLPKITDLFNLESIPFHETGLTKAQIEKIIDNNRKLWYQVTVGHPHPPEFQKGDLICIDPQSSIKQGDTVAYSLKGKESVGIVKCIDKKLYIEDDNKSISLDSCTIYGKVLVKIKNY